MPYTCDGQCEYVMMDTQFYLPLVVWVNIFMNSGLVANKAHLFKFISWLIKDYS